MSEPRQSEAEIIAGLLRSARNDRRGRAVEQALAAELRRLRIHAARRIPDYPGESAEIAEALGEKSYPSLEAAPGPIDIVNIFRRSEAAPEIVESAIRIGAKAVWMQEGVVHEKAAARARAAGMVVVMDRCLLKEHRKL